MYRFISNQEYCQFIIDFRQMTELYQTYQQQLAKDLETVQNKMGDQSPSKQHFKQLRSILTDCDKNIKLIQTQLSNDPSPNKVKQAMKLKSYRQTYANLKKQIYAKQNDFEYQTNKKQLMSTRPSSNQYIRSQQKGMDVNKRLKQSVSVMYQNLDISENVNNELQSQTTKLVNTKGKVIGIREDLHKSERKIKSIMLRIRKNRLVLRAVIAIILLVIIIIIVSYFR